MNEKDYKILKQKYKCKDCEHFEYGESCPAIWSLQGKSPICGDFVLKEI